MSTSDPVQARKAVLETGASFIKSIDADLDSARAYSGRTGFQVYLYGLGMTLRTSVLSLLVLAMVNGLALWLAAWYGRLGMRRHSRAVA